MIITGKPHPNIPWENAPDNSSVVWRSYRNPIITRDDVPDANSVFNSAVVPFGEGFAGVFRVDDTERNMQLRTGFSADGITWDIEHRPISFLTEDTEIGKYEYRYDPRVCWIDDRYYLTWCNGYHGPTIGIGETFDFKEFRLIENAFLPFNRNGVLFPRRIKGKYFMLSRPSDNGHTQFGDIFCSESPDMIHWGVHRHVMAATVGWQATKIGAGPTPIETDEGWLLFYHGVLTSCNGFVYSFGAALLDLDIPWKVIYRTKPYLLNPREVYECMGDVPNVVFPCAALTDPPTGRISIYYGGADTVTCIAYTEIDRLTRFIKENSY